MMDYTEYHGSHVYSVYETIADLDGIDGACMVAYIYLRQYDRNPSFSYRIFL